MEVTFQNKREDFEAFYEYMLNHTKEGERIRQGILIHSLVAILVGITTISFILWGISRNLDLSIFTCLGAIIVFDAALLILRQKLGYFFGRKVYRNQEKFLEQKDIQRFILPKTITIDNEWLEIRSSETSHRYRWRQVDQIGLTNDFIFIHVGTCPVIYIPKRDFPSETVFIDFGKQLKLFQEMARNIAS